MTSPPRDDASVPLPALRIGDVDRERAAAVLRRAAGEGRLSLAEADERMAAAYAARTAADLAPLLVDLPAESPERAHRARTDSPGALQRHLAVVLVRPAGGGPRRGGPVVPRP